MKLEDAAAFTAGCFNGEAASCSCACPYRLDVRSFLEKCEKGRWNAAYKTLRNATVFPVIACELCPAPCENHCQRTQTGDEPVSVGLIEDACIRYAKNRKPDSFVIPPKQERIAVIGAGIAGLTAALCLAQKRYNVTVFEKESGWGGALRAHPRFADFDADISLQYSAAETDFKFNSALKSLDELSGFDVVYIASGAQGEDFGLLDGWDSALLTTSKPGVFMGGGITGADVSASIAQGLRLSKTAEVFMQTGRAFEADGSETGTQGCGRYVNHEGTPSAPRIVPAEPEGYTEQEARAEAARCMQCDCNACIKSCEMLNSFRKKPKKIATEVFTDTHVNPPYSSHALTRQAYSCNMCGHCKEVCPADSDIGGLLQLSRAARVEGGTAYPAALHDYWLREMDFSTGEASFFAPPERTAPDIGGDAYKYAITNGLASRTALQKDTIAETAASRTALQKDTIAETATSRTALQKDTITETAASRTALQKDTITETAASRTALQKYVFFPGCQLGAHNPEHLIKSFEFLQMNYNAGIYVTCCGAPAYWAGDTARQNANFERIREVYAELGNAKFVFTCATCESMFNKFLPEIPRISLYELLTQAEGLNPEHFYDDASVFDPCNARVNPEMEEAVRSLAKKSGTSLYELPEKNRCCGYGGHMRLGNPELYDKITGNRAAMGEKPYIVYCANCLEVFKSRGKESTHILDIVFGSKPAEKTPGIEEKRKNAAEVKKTLMKELLNVDFIPETNEWDNVQLIVSDTLKDKLNDKLISLSDVREVIWYAESTGDKFVGEDGLNSASLEKPVLTYWVTYKNTGGGAYEVLEAYSHRMHFRRED